MSSGFASRCQRFRHGLSPGAAVPSLVGAGAVTADGRGDADGNSGTTVTWDNNDGGSFQGTAQFPGLGPVGYCG